MNGGLTTRREDSYAGKTVAEVVRAIVVRNKFTWLVGKKLAGQVIAHVDQTGESDANFLSRLAKEFDAIATVKNGTLLFIPAGEPTSGSACHCLRSASTAHRATPTPSALPIGRTTTA
ncbi:contractile injection system protein, VgrG/Pvc8 family [Ralstonia pickettii]|uniref:contractile injection system protein, VgrG/Pvc8 family n=1 Tax=Ralstonia pickettii TaxID=329 RepID=UPI0021506E49|nr:contractile injection system protein, VgrG/Pvc8 family [Ralstonia pickettii]